MQTQGAIGNLINRYRAVLNKCRLLNVFGSLAVAGLLVMGGAAGVGAATPVDWQVDEEATLEIDEKETISSYKEGEPNTTVKSLSINGGELEVNYALINDKMKVSMVDGKLTITSNGNDYAGIQGEMFIIDNGEITVKAAADAAGDTIMGRASIGASKGFILNNGTVTLDAGGAIFGGGSLGTQLKGGTVTMGDYTAILFSGNGKAVIGKDATINVNGSNTQFIIGNQTLQNTGNISVADGAELTLRNFSNAYSGGFYHAGGSFTTTGVLTVDPDMELTIGDGTTLDVTGQGSVSVKDGATLQTVGTGHVTTETGTSVTLEKGATLNASAASAEVDTTLGNDGYGAIRGAGTATLADGVKVSISDAQDGKDYALLSKAMTDANPNAIGKVILQSTSAAIGLKYDPDTQSVVANAQSASKVLPNLDGELGTLAYNMAKTSPDGKDVMSSQPGRRFLARALDSRYGGSVENRTATIESAARTAAIAGVPQMTMAAQTAGVNAISQRTSIATPSGSSLQAVAADGSVQTGASAGDAMKNGFAMWIMPLYQSWNAWGMEGGNLDMDVNGALGGLAVGADYTFADAFRAGITVNMGGGYAEGSGDFNKTTNDFTFWGLGAYLGWSKDNFGLTADINHTWVYNDVEQDLAASMQMDTLKSDITSRALSAGLRGEYKLATDALDITPHVGVRYTWLTTDNYDVESGNGTVLEGDTIHQGIWTFPIGVAFSKDVQMDSGWYVKPSLDVAVVPAAGDIKARGNINFTGVPGSAELSTQTIDYITYMGQAGLEFGNDNVKLGVNYNLQMGAQSTAHGVFGTLRYEF